MTDQAQRPTIHEVSRAAGVSISSVSRALNGQTRNPDIIRRVHEAVQSTGYVPSTIAQSLRSQRVGQIALAVEDIGNPAYLAMVRAIQPALRAAGLRLVLHSTDGIVGEEIDVVQNLGNGYVDGLIICPIRPDASLIEAISRSPVPIVVIGSVPGGIAVDNVRGQSTEGAALATAHLIDRGSRRIALINGPGDTVPGQARPKGYERVLRANECYDDNLVEQADAFTFEAGYEATKRLLVRGGEFDGLLGITDRLALGALHALRNAGRSVPGDVRLVGMDNSEVATTAVPTLTSVDLGAVERGRLAAELMISRLENREQSPRALAVAPAVVERESSR
jgi:LacI family transcriptional regulator